MLGRFGAVGIVGLLVMLGGILVVAWQNIVLAAGLALVVAGLGLVVYGLVKNLMSAFGLGGGMGGMV
ncbi:MAG: hypothetical protein ABEH35_04090 [Haloarculaceae archaeon]